MSEQRTGKARNQELQKTAVLGSTHVLAKVLKLHKTLIMADSSSCTMIVTTE